MTFAQPTFELTDGRKISILDIRGTKVLYVILGTDISPAWVEAEALKKLQKRKLS